MKHNIFTDQTIYQYLYRNKKDTFSHIPSTPGFTKKNLKIYRFVQQKTNQIYMINKKAENIKDTKLNILKADTITIHMLQESTSNK